MPQAVLKSAASNTPDWWQRVQFNARLMLLGCRELLALLSLMAGLSLSFAALAASLGRFSGT